MRATTASLLLLLGVTAVPVHAQERSAVAQLINRDKEVVATARLQQAGELGVFIELDVTDLPPGVHGFHIHETGLCTADFAEAGGHFNPHDKAHGFLSADGAHAGDLLNIRVPASGSVEVERLATEVTLEAGEPASLFDEDSSALVIHEGPDDYVSQPAGDSGDPIACGVIRR